MKLASTRLAAVALIFLLCCSCHAASLDKVEFNWPPPREIGEPGFFAVAKGGQPACSIVLPANPSDVEERAARVLKLYLDLVTGGAFEIKREPGSGPAIYLGETGVGKRVPLDLPAVKYAHITLPNVHGYLVKTVDKDTLVIRGQRDLGTLYGVMGFLRDYAGVRRYWPSEPGGIGDVYEHKPDLSIPRLTWRDWPYMIGRHVGFNVKAWEANTKGLPLTMMNWYRMGFTLSMMHNFFRLLPPKEYGKSHPEYYPEINGQRLVPTKQTDWQPCVSNPEVVDICARKIIEAFDQNPALICHALAVNDGSGDCCCVKCRAMDAPDADVNTGWLTDRYVKFMNAVADKVAAKHPDRLIGFLSYGSLKFPPSTVKLHPNLIPFYCAMSRGLYQGWDDWIAAGAKNMGHYGYHDDRWFIIPKINPHQEARRMRFIVASNVGRGYYKEFNPTYPLDAHAAMVVAEMMWDPRLDENKLLAEYYDGMFRESAREMRVFHEILESDYENWLKLTSPPHSAGPDRSDLDLDHSYEQFQVLTAKGADRAWSALLKAEAKAKDPNVRERIALVRSIFSFVRPCTHEYWTVKALPEVQSAATAERLARKALALAREKAAIKRDVMEKEPVKQWTMLYREPYDQIKVGVIPQEVHMAIDRGFESAFRAHPEERPVWERLSRVPDPVIAQSAQGVVAMADIQWPRNLVIDGGFESANLPELFHAAAKQAAAAISTRVPHSGLQCALVFDAKMSSIVKGVVAKPGEKFWVSAWLRAEDYQGPHSAPAIFGVRVNARNGEKIVDWTYLRAEVGEDWRQVRFPYTMPAGADKLEVLVSAQRMHAGSRFWVDDISVVRVPIPLLEEGAGSQRIEQNAMLRGHAFRPEARSPAHPSRRKTSPDSY